MTLLQMLHHLGDLELFCLRVQVAMQRQERKEEAEGGAGKRKQTVDERCEGEPWGQDDDGCERDAREAGVSKSAALSAAAAVKAPVPVLKISVPDIRDDEDIFFGEDVDSPMEFDKLRSRVKQLRQRRPALTQVARRWWW